MGRSHTFTHHPQRGNLALRRALCTRQPDVVIKSLIANGAKTDLIHKAIEYHNVAMVCTLLRNGYSPNNPNQMGVPPLFAAAENGSVRVCEALLATEGIDTTVTILGNTILHVAAATDYSGRLVSLFLRHKMDPNVVGNRGATPLHSAAKNENVVAARMLVEAGASVDVQDDIGRTPLQLAVVNNSTATAELLIAHGADYSLVDDDGLTLAQSSKNRGFNAIARMLENAAVVPRLHTEKIEDVRK